jgi:hypothetical protein
MDRDLLDVLIETTQLQLERLRALPKNEAAEDLITIEQERRLGILAGEQRN